MEKKKANSDDSVTTKAKSNKLNLPNKLVLLRFFLAFVIFMLLLFVPKTIEKGWYFTFFSGDNSVIISYFLIVSLVIFIAAAYTDYLDGMIARKNNQVTDFGKFFDPIADKILISIVMIFFAIYHYLPIWVVIFFLIRDIMINALRMVLSTHNKVLSADKYGKLKTLFQVFGLSIIFLIHPEPITGSVDNVVKYDYGSILQLATVPIYIALYFSVYSGIKYYKDNWKYIKN